MSNTNRTFKRYFSTSTDIIANNSLEYYIANINTAMKKLKYRSQMTKYISKIKILEIFDEFAKYIIKNKQNLLINTQTSTDDTLSDYMTKESFNGMLTDMKKNIQSPISNSNSTQIPKSPYSSILIDNKVKNNYKYENVKNETVRYDNIPLINSFKDSSDNDENPLCSPKPFISENKPFNDISYKREQLKQIYTKQISKSNRKESKKVSSDSEQMNLSTNISKPLNLSSSLTKKLNTIRGKSVEPSSNNNKVYQNSYGLKREASRKLNFESPETRYSVNSRKFTNNDDEIKYMVNKFEKEQLRRMSSIKRFSQLEDNTEMERQRYVSPEKYVENNLFNNPNANKEIKTNQNMNMPKEFVINDDIQSNNLNDLLSEQYETKSTEINLKSPSLSLDQYNSDIKKYFRSNNHLESIKSANTKKISLDSNNSLIEMSDDLHKKRKSLKENLIKFKTGKPYVNESYEKIDIKAIDSASISVHSKQNSSRKGSHNINFSLYTRNSDNQYYNENIHSFIDEYKKSISSSPEIIHKERLSNRKDNHSYPEYIYKTSILENDLDLNDKKISFEIEDNDNEIDYNLNNDYSVKNQKYLNEEELKINKTNYTKNNEKSTSERIKSKKNLKNNDLYVDKDENDIIIIKPKNYDSDNIKFDFANNKSYNLKSKNNKSNIKNQKKYNTSPNVINKPKNPNKSSKLNNKNKNIIKPEELYPKNNYSSSQYTIKDYINNSPKPNFNNSPITKSDNSPITYSNSNTKESIVLTKESNSNTEINMIENNFISFKSNINTENNEDSYDIVKNDTQINNFNKSVDQHSKLRQIDVTLSKLYEVTALNSNSMDKYDNQIKKVKQLLYEKANYSNDKEKSINFNDKTSIKNENFSFDKSIDKSKTNNSNATLYSIVKNHKDNSINQYHKKYSNISNENSKSNNFIDSKSNNSSANKKQSINSNLTTQTLIKQDSNNTKNIIKIIENSEQEYYNSNDLKYTQSTITKESKDSKDSNELKNITMSTNSREFKENNLIKDMQRCQMEYEATNRTVETLDLSKTLSLSNTGRKASLNSEQFFMGKNNLIAKTSLSNQSLNERDDTIYEMDFKKESYSTKSKNSIESEDNYLSTTNNDIRTLVLEFSLNLGSFIYSNKDNYDSNVYANQLNIIRNHIDSILIILSDKYEIFENKYYEYAKNLSEKKTKSIKYLKTLKIYYPEEEEKLGAEKLEESRQLWQQEKESAEKLEICRWEYDSDTLINTVRKNLENLNDVETNLGISKIRLKNVWDLSGLLKEINVLLAKVIQLNDQNRYTSNGSEINHSNKYEIIIEKVKVKYEKIKELNK